MPTDVYLGNVPTSPLDDADNIIFAEGINIRKVPYGDVKKDIIGEEALKTKAPKTKEAINELVQDLLESTGYGVVSGGVVTAQSTPNMTVQATGCTLKTATGARQVVAANAALVITTADTTNPRKDIVYVDSVGVIQYLQGTAAASPTAPTTPTGGSLLAEIYVAANATTITNANITDKRKILISTDWLNAQLSDIEQKVNKLPIAQYSNILTVGKIGCNFTTINQAINYAKTYATLLNRVLIHILPGTYNEEIDLHDNVGIDIMGSGYMCTIVQHASVYPNSPIYVMGDTMISGITFSATVENGLGDSYAVHVESQSHSGTVGNILFENCKFISDTSRSAIGVGCGLGNVIFRNCIAVAYNNAAVYIHNYPLATNSGQNLEIVNMEAFTNNAVCVYLEDVANILNNVVSKLYITFKNITCANGSFSYKDNSGTFSYIPSGKPMSLSKDSYNDSILGLNIIGSIGISPSGWLYKPTVKFMGNYLYSIPVNGADKWDWTILQIQDTASNTFTASVTINSVRENCIVLADSSDFGAGAYITYTLKGVPKA